MLNFQALAPQQRAEQAQERQEREQTQQRRDNRVLFASGDLVKKQNTVRRSKKKRSLSPVDRSTSQADIAESAIMPDFFSSGSHSNSHNSSFSSLSSSDGGVDDESDFVEEKKQRGASRSRRGKNAAEFEEEGFLSSVWGFMFGSTTTAAQQRLQHQQQLLQQQQQRHLGSAMAISQSQRGSNSSFATAHTTTNLAADMDVQEHQQEQEQKTPHKHHQSKGANAASTDLDSLSSQSDAQGSSSRSRHSTSNIGDDALEQCRARERLPGHLTARSTSSAALLEPSAIVVPAESSGVVKPAAAENGSTGIGVAGSASDDDVGDGHGPTTVDRQQAVHRRGEHTREFSELEDVLPRTNLISAVMLACWDNISGPKVEHSWLPMSSHEQFATEQEIYQASSQAHPETAYYQADSSETQPAINKRRKSPTPQNPSLREELIASSPRRRTRSDLPVPIPIVTASDPDDDDVDGSGDNGIGDFNRKTKNGSSGLDEMSSVADHSPSDHPRTSSKRHASERTLPSVIDAARQALAAEGAKYASAADAQEHRVPDNSSEASFFSLPGGPIPVPPDVQSYIARHILAGELARSDPKAEDGSVIETKFHVFADIGLAAVATMFTAIGVPVSHAAQSMARGLAMAAQTGRAQPGMSAQMAAQMAAMISVGSSNTNSPVKHALCLVFGRDHLDDYLAIHHIVEDRLFYLAAKAQVLLNNRETRPDAMAMFNAHVLTAVHNIECIFEAGASRVALNRTLWWDPWGVGTGRRGGAEKLRRQMRDPQTTSSLLSPSLSFAGKTRSNFEVASPGSPPHSHSANAHHRYDARFLAVCITSHMCTMGCTAVVGSDIEQVNQLVDSLLCFSLTAGDHRRAAYATSTSEEFIPGLSIQGIIVPSTSSSQSGRGRGMSFAGPSTSTESTGSAMDNESGPFDFRASFSSMRTNASAQRTPARQSSAFASTPVGKNATVHDGHNGITTPGLPPTPVPPPGRRNALVHEHLVIQSLSPVTVIDLDRRRVFQTHPYHEFKLLREAYFDFELGQLLPRVQPATDNRWTATLADGLFTQLRTPSPLVEECLQQARGLPAILRGGFISATVRGWLRTAICLMKYVEAEVALHVQRLVGKSVQQTGGMEQDPFGATLDLTAGSVQQQLKLKQQVLQQQQQQQRNLQEKTPMKPETARAADGDSGTGGGGSEGVGDLITLDAETVSRIRVEMLLRSNEDWAIILAIAERLSPGIYVACAGDPAAIEEKFLELFESF